MDLVTSFLELLQQVAAVFTVPTFNSFVIVLTGWVSARRRVITRMIETADAVDINHRSAFHRAFAAAHWSLDELGLAIVGLIRRWQDDGPVLLSLNDTLGRKRGLKVFGVGMHHDPLLSTRKLVLVNWGHGWVVLSMIVAFPFRTDHYFSLPILFRLYVNKKTADKKKLRYRARPELAAEMLPVLCKARENQRLRVVGDSTCGGQSVLAHPPENRDLTSRLGLDARLCDPPPLRKPRTNGRPRKQGRQPPTPRQMLNQLGRRLTLNIHGRRDRSRVANHVARVYTVPARPLRVVAVEPLAGGRTMRAFYSTCHQATAKQVLAWYARRWSLEETFCNTKGHLGFEEPQGCTRRAVERTALIAMLLYSLILLWFASEGHRRYRAPYRPWYRTKSGASFTDMLNTLRCQSACEQVLSAGPEGQGSKGVMRASFIAVQQAA